MNRPQRFRGLATDPGVQRKAPQAVIRRAGTAVGKTIWIDPYRASSAERSTSFFVHRIKGRRRTALLKSPANTGLFGMPTLIRQIKACRDTGD